MHWNKITVVGVGLLGGSLGLALRQRRLAGSVVGYVRRAASVRECGRVGAVTVATRNLEEAVSDADLIILCTPIARMRPLLREMLPILKRGAIITDVGSAKGSVVKALEPLAARAGAYFVGSHPMAGAEKTGVNSARANLFVNAVCVVTPTSRTDRQALRKVERFWKSLGTRVLRLSPQQHDLLVSRSSHLPHLLAVELAHFVLDPTHPAAQAALCANGFRDTTRIASGSPEMWRDIALANCKPILRSLDGFTGRLRRFRRLLLQGKPDALYQFFAEAKQRRDKWARRARSGSPE